MLTALNSQVSTKSSLNSLRSDKQKFYNKVEPYYQNNGTKVLKSDSVTQSNKEFQVLWHNLCYTVPVSKTENKLILNNLNGYFVSGEVTAILGPSGAGKSTLLKCICGGLKKGLRGEIRFRTTNRLFIGYVPQDDYLIEELTIIESLILASQLNAINNSQKNSGDHYSVANNLIKRFGLERITETKAKHLSGGQRKRLSIALEVLFKPDVLILDEPTTGLDSPSCSHVISMMRELVSDKHNQVAIVCTVHQPSVAIFNSFNRIYMLSINGQCIYNGSPLNLVNTITKAGLKCPSGNTPIDYLMEVANGDYGENSVEKLAIEAQTHDITQTVTANTYVYASVMKRKLHSFWQQMPLLFKRSQLVLYRDIRMSFLRVFCTIITGVFLTLAYSDKVGTASGCIPRELEVWSTSLVELSSKFEETIALINQNLSLLFLSMMTGLVIGLSPVLLNFPREVQVFRKECENGWYSCKSYYISKTVSDIPLQVILPILFILLVYNFTGQPREWHRIANMITVTILMSLISQSMGEMVSAVWMDKPNISVFLGIMIPIPMTLFGGFLVRTSQMPFYMQPLSWLSFLRFAFEAMVVSIYGYHRCDYQYQMFLASVNATAITKPLWVQHLPLLMQFMDDNSNEESQLSDMDRLYTLFGGNLAIEDNKVQTSTPIIINYFSLNDSHYMRAIILLMIYLIALKFITYFVLLFKINTKK